MPIVHAVGKINFKAQARWGGVNGRGPTFLTVADNIAYQPHVDLRENAIAGLSAEGYHTADLKHEASSS